MLLVKWNLLFLLFIFLTRPKNSRVLSITVYIRIFFHLNSANYAWRLCYESSTYEYKLPEVYLVKDVSDADLRRSFPPRFWVLYGLSLPFRSRLVFTALSCLYYYLLIFGKTVVDSSFKFTSAIFISLLCVFIVMLSYVFLKLNLFYSSNIAAVDLRSVNFNSVSISLYFSLLTRTNRKWGSLMLEEVTSGFYDLFTFSVYLIFLVWVKSWIVIYFNLCSYVGDVVASIVDGMFTHISGS